MKPFQGKLVYVNYARAEDFQLLKSLNVSTKGKILLARYGKIFRGDKVRKYSVMVKVMLSFLYFIQ